MSTDADVTATFCATFVDELARAGVGDAVICPGSRSTPMALALLREDRLRVHVHTDERAAAFMALGLGLERGVPAVVLTTSGTAAVELHPAVVEAHHAKVPLIALTADRPPELLGVGAPQTIDQRNLFGSAVRAFHDPGVPDDAARGTWRRVAAAVVADAVGSPPGPVQCNLAFREPLLGAATTPPPGRPNGAPWIGRRRCVEPDDDLVGAVADGVAGRRGVIVAGGGVRRPGAVLELARRLGWPVLADQRSGCRSPLATIAHFDGLLRHAGFASSHAPDVVVRCGGLPASKVLGEWLAGLDAWQIGVEADGDAVDPWGSLTSVVAAEPGAFCAAVARALDDAGVDPAAPEAWAYAWGHADAELGAVVVTELQRHRELTEPAVARDVLAALPDDARLVVSSSMPVRDLEWYGAPRDGVVVHANRGANGIDGVVSTAVGVALASGEPTAVLVGDLAFLHDTNALLGLAGRDVRLTIVVVDNDGGGIFEHLPQAAALERPAFERLFGTPHGLDLARVAGAYGIEVRRIGQQAEVGPAVIESSARGGVTMVHVRTDRQASVRLHHELHDAMAAAVAAMVEGVGG